MIAGFVIATAMAGAIPSATQPGAGPLLRSEYAHVLAVGRRDLPGSGIFAVYANFDIASAGGQARMHVLWAGVAQFLPQVGSICTIGYRRERLAGGNMHEHDTPVDVRDHDILHNVVYELDCGQAPGQPPAGQRGSPSAR